MALCATSPRISGPDGMSVLIALLSELVQRGPFAPVFHRLGDERLVHWLDEDVTDEPALKVAC